MAKNRQILSLAVMLLLSTSCEGAKISKGNQSLNALSTDTFLQIDQLQKYADASDVANEMNAYKLYNMEKVEKKQEAQQEEDKQSKDSQSSAEKMAEEMDNEGVEKPVNLEEVPVEKPKPKAEAMTVFEQQMVGNPYEGEKVEKDAEQVQQEQAQTDQDVRVSQKAAAESEGDRQIRIDLQQVDSLYVGKLYVGAQKQPVRVIFDSGSEHLAISSDLCKGCPTMAYAQTKSKSSKLLSQDVKSVLYGSAKFEGKETEDQACMSEKAGCIDFKFLSLTSGQGLDQNADGILGLSPEISTDRTDQHLVWSLMNQGKISKAAFSLNLAESGSYAVFGGIDYSQIVGGKDGLRPFRNNPDIFSHIKAWALSGKAIYYGAEQIGDKGTYPAVMDTGSTVLSVPSQLFQSIKAEWQKTVKDLDCTSDPNFCQSVSSCDSFKKDLKPVGFLIGGGSQAGGDTVFEITPDQYIFQYLDKKCQFGIVENKLDQFNNKNFIFGQAFLQHFYSVYNYENEQISLGVNVQSKDVVRMYSPGEGLAQEDDEPKVVSV